MIKDLFKKKKEIDIIDLVREELKGVTLDFVNENNDILSKLTTDKQKELFGKAHLILKDFDFIADNIINAQGNYAIKEAGNMEQVLFARGTINGIILLREQLKRLSNLYLDENKKKELFNKHNLI